MLKNTNIGKRLVIAFSMMTIFIIAIGIGALVSIETLSNTVERMYRHPLAVTNAVLNSHVHIVSIHRSMKDVVLASNEQEIKLAANLVDENEKEVLRNLQIVQERYLGDKGQVTQTIQAIIDWRPIREEVISLVLAGQFDAAEEITKGKGANHLRLVEEKIRQLEEFATTKAEDFKINTDEMRIEILTYMGVLLLAVTLLNIGIASVVIRKINKQIGEHNEAGTALSKTKKLLSDTERFGKIGGWEVDRETMIQTWTEETYRIHEVDLNFEPDMSKGFNFYAPSAKPIIERAFNHTVETGDPFDLELELITAKGNRIWVHSVGRAQQKEGVTKIISGSIQDITERKHAQEERLRYEHIVSNSSDMMAFVDRNFVYLFVNPRYPEAFGLSKADFIGKTAAEVFGEKVFNETLAPHAKRCLSFGETINYQAWVEFPKTGRRFMDITYSPFIKEKKVEGFIVNARDVTEGKQAEDRLTTSEKRYRELYENSPLGYQSLDIEGCFIESNTSLCWMLGYERNEVIGRWFGDFLTDESAEEFKNNFPKFKARGEVHAVPFDLVAKDGQVISVEIDGRIGHNEQGDFKQTHCVIQDVTTRKQLSSELVQHRHHLEKLVEVRTEQLSEAQQRAEVASKAKSAFLANMSHEIRTPMNAIIGLTHLMQQAGMQPEQLDRLNKIEASGDHLLSIINDILDLSKIEAGKLNLEQTDFDLGDLLGDLQSLYQVHLSTKNLSFDTDLDDVPRWLRGDLTRLRQALLNYVGNAVKFTKQGSIFVRATKLDENDDGMLLRFEVTDTGVGIEPDNLVDLFAPFEQADVSTTRKYGGTGLGLVITRRLAQLMGGEAGAESESGKGSTFWFTAWLGHGQGVMPTKSSKRVERAETGLPDYYKGCHILLAEDNAINSEVAVAVLSSVGLVVDTAKNGNEAVDKVRANDYDLILMDIQMPEMDGLEATRLIRTMKGKDDLSILAMTANVFEEDRRACLEAGMNDFVAKPIDVNEMFDKLIRWLPGENL